MQTLYQIALVNHIIGLTLLAGTTLVDYILARHFWKQYFQNPFQAIAINDATSKFQILLGIGIILLILSGITMMGITHGAFGEQIWFQIKFGLVILIIINGLAVGRRQGSKLKKLLSQETTNFSDGSVQRENLKVEMLKVKGRITWFHCLQLFFFILVFVLSVFKFN
jgi:uncharacterized membrane protein SirB2